MWLEPAAVFEHVEHGSDDVRVVSRHYLVSAQRYYREAITLGAELGMRPLVAHCHLGLGKLYRRMDKREEAKEHLATATTMYRDMDMRFWLEKAEAELK